jgi:streptomycin 6-kinase
VRIPQALEDEWRADPEWLAELPGLAAACAERWGLELEEPVDTPRSLVVPAGDVVLKVNAPSHHEADHEPDALACWGGAGAVRLLARDDARRAFLIERCRPGTRLWDAGADEAAVVAKLLPRVRVDPAPPHPFRSLAGEAARWAEDVPARYARQAGVFERRLLDFAVDVFRSANASAASLVNQDLHGGNILRSEREPWLVIDPKPLVGERELDGVGLLRNAAFASRSPTTSVRRWLDVLADLGLDRERLRAWGVAHALAWGWYEASGWSRASVAAAQTILAA